MTTENESSGGGPEADGTAVGSEHQGLGRRTLLNSAQLTIALMTSWALALIGRFVTPRVLGTELFGQLSFVESISTLAMSLMAFGIGDYIRKEVSADPTHAQDFARPLWRVQFVAGVLITVVMSALVAATMGTRLGVVALAFGVSQIAIVLGRTDAAYLQAKHDVRVVSISAIATKLIWLILLLAMFGAGIELLALPLALLISETVRTAWMNRSVRKTFGRAPTAPVRAATDVIWKSTPFYVNSLNIIFMAYAVRILIGIMGTTDAVAYMSTADLAISVPMLLTPIVGWVAVPLFTNLRARRPELLWERVRDLIDMFAAIVCAISVGLFTMSDDLMPLLFGKDFQSSSDAFALLTLSIPATYFTMMIGCAFIADDRSWQNTRVNMYTMILVVAGVAILLAAVATDNSGLIASMSASVITVGEWVTVVWLIILRPFAMLRRGTIVRLVLLVAVLVVATGEKLSDGSATVRLGTLVAASLIVLSVLPHLVRQGRIVLKPNTTGRDDTVAVD